MIRTLARGVALVAYAGGLAVIAKPSPEAPAVDHCDFLGVVVDQVPEPGSPFVSPTTAPDTERTLSIVQTCRIRTTGGVNGSTQIEERNPILDLRGDDLAVLRDALGTDGTAMPDDGTIGLP